MRGRINCDIKKLHVEVSKTQNELVYSELNSGIDDLIEQPDRGRIEYLENKLKNIMPRPERVSTNRKLKMEKNRYDEHLELWNYLRDSSKELYKDLEVLTTGSDYVKSRLHWIQGQFKRAFNELTFANPRAEIYNSGLNNHHNWDAPKIKSIRKRIQREQDKATKFKGKKLTGFQNNVKAPQKLVAQLDPTGAAGEVIEDIQFLLDTYLMDGFSYKQEIDGISRAISRAVSSTKIAEDTSISGSELIKAGNDFHNDLMHGQVRNVIPKNIPTKVSGFQTWRNSWEGSKFFEIQKSPSERHQIGPSGAEYVLIPMHPEKKGAAILKKQRNKDISDGKFSKDNQPGRNENAYYAYRIPSNWTGFLRHIKSKKNLSPESLKNFILENELEEGFYRALEHKVFPYDLIKGTQTPKKKFANFVRGVDFRGKVVYQPPKDWMPSLWDAVERKRKFNEDIASVLLEGNMLNAQEEHSFVRNSLIKQLSESGLDDESIQEVMAIDEIGMEDNYWKDRDGNWVNPNTKFTRTDRWSYDTVSFHPVDNNKMIQSALDGISNEMEEIDATLTGYQNILSDNESTLGDKAEAQENIAIGQSRLDELTPAFNAMNDKLFPEDEEDRQSIMLADRILSTKHRQLYTDNTLRRKDRKVDTELVDAITRSIAMTRIKTKAFKAVASLRRNPALVKYIVNELRNVANMPNTEAGFIFDYSDERIAELLSKIPFYNTTGKSVKETLLWVRSLKTSINLGFNTGVGNQPQRLNIMLTSGFEKWQKSSDALRNGDDNFTADEIWEQITETGVLEPANAMIDILTSGMTGSSTNPKEALIPYRDMIKLWKNTTLDGWLSDSKGWDEILTNARKRTVSEVKTVKELKLTQDELKKELKRIKTGLWEFFHEDTKNVKHLRKKLKDLKIGLRQQYANRLVKWRLHWFPIGGKSFWTLAGGEDRMRAEAAYDGFTKMLDMGRIDTSKKGWKYTDSKDAVDAARLSVYVHMFGMNSPHLAKMFRGAFGATYWQWKPYDWFQSQDDYRKFDNYLLTLDSPLLIKGVEAPTYLLAHIMKKGLRSGIGAGIAGAGIISEKALGPGGVIVGASAGYLLGKTKKYKQLIKWMDGLHPNLPIDKKWDNKTLDDLANFVLTRGISSAITTFMYYQPEVYGAWAILAKTAKWSGFRNPLNQRAVFGTSSPLISRSLHAIMMFMLIMEYLGLGDSGLDEDEVTEDIVREYGSLTMSTILLLVNDIEKNKKRAFKPWIPSPVKEVIEMEEFGTIIEDFLN